MLYDCYSRKGSSFSEEDFIQSIRLIESFIVRRGVLNLAGNDYWTIFANVARSIDEQSPLESMKVALARQRYYFPDDEDFAQEIQNVDLYMMRKGLCRHILVRLENDGQKEPSPVGEYSIEHVMPQDVDDVREWQDMLGEKWEEIHEEWLHRLGNLTLTGYNSEMSNRPFSEKKSIPGGFDQSAARLNQYVKNQPIWTAKQMLERGAILAERALSIWPHHDADERRLREAAILELRELAAERDPSSIDMNDNVRSLFDMLLARIRDIGDVIEVVENVSVCCHAPDFFVEMLPMSYYVRLILPLVLDEVEVPDDLHVEDTTSWRFVPNRVHTECDMLINVYREDDIPAAIEMVRRAYEREDE